MTAAATSQRPPEPLRPGELQRFMPLVRRNAIRIANRFPRAVTVADLISIGWVGLLEALGRGRGAMPDAELDNFVVCRVRGAMLDHLRSLDPATRATRQNHRRLSATAQRLSQRLGRPPESDEMAAALGLQLDAYHSLSTTARCPRAQSLDTAPLGELTSHREDPEQQAARHLLVEKAAQAIERLPERLQLVVGLVYQRGCSQKEVAGVLGVGPARVCQLHGEAMARIRAQLGAA